MGRIPKKKFCELYVPPEEVVTAMCGAENVEVVSQQPEPVLETPSEAPQNARSTDVATPTGESMEFAGKFAALSKRVLELKSQRQWLVDLDKEYVETVSQLRLLEERKEALAAEMESIVQVLQHPNAKEDEAAYDAIVRMLQR